MSPQPFPIKAAFIRWGNRTMFMLDDYTELRTLLEDHIHTDIVNFSHRSEDGSYIFDVFLLPYGAITLLPEHKIGTILIVESMIRQLEAGGMLEWPVKHLYGGS